MAKKQNASMGIFALVERLHKRSRHFSISLSSTSSCASKSGSPAVKHCDRLLASLKCFLRSNVNNDVPTSAASKMLSESAICLIQDAVDTPGGIWTTAPAMGDKLIQRLEDNAGLSFTLES